MRTWWAWASVFALCVVPALAQAKDRGQDRRDDGGRHSSEGRRSERGARGWNRERSDHGAQRRGGSGERPTWAPRQRPDSGRDGGWRSGSSDRFDRRDGGRYSDRRDSGRRDSNRGWSARDNRQRWDRDRRNDGGWRGSYDRGSRRGWMSFRARPLRYRGAYRYGYFHGHGYYFPRYYYDYDSYSIHSSVRILVEPAETEVYVDGYYAGVVDDFDGIFQRLYLAPGSHEITLRLDGYQTWSAEIFAAPGSTVRLRHDMLPGPSGPVVDDPGADEEPEPPQ